MPSSEIQKYENELSEFLIQRINDAGGSLQFQHLSGLMHQLKFEIKDAFGTSKSNLMRYLRSHSRLFEIDPKGNVNVIGTLENIEYDDNETDNDTNEIPRESTLPSDIKNGKGVISKIFSEFAIIEAKKPFKTFVFFTPKEFGGTKDELFLDLNLQVKSKVCFNAIHGHNDYEIKYRATKVWETSDSDDECSSRRKNAKAENLKPLTGIGIIRKCCPQFGFISVSGKKDETVIFYRRSVKDCDISLTQMFRINEEVEFVAEKVPKKDSGTQWVATEVKKKKKKKSQQISDGETEPAVESAKLLEKKNPNIKENELGKISPCQTGAVIKFGKDFYDLADGKSADYYLYGCKVNDIAFEFSEGDEVRFDAVKSRDNCVWKAVLVWIGEKPQGVKSNRENKDKDENLKGCISSKKVFSKQTDSVLEQRSKQTRARPCNVEHKEKKNDKEQKKKSLDHRSFDWKPPKLQNKFNKDKLRTNKITVKKNLSKKSNNFCDDDEGDDVCLGANKFKNTESKSTPKYLENIDSCPVSDETLSDEDTPESSSSSSDEGTFKYLKSGLTYTDEKLQSSKDETSDVSEVASTNPKKASIEKFENLTGTVKSVTCKVASIICPKFPNKNVDFLLNTFYVDGKSVEEQQVDDLKEVTKAGDTVNFNCFEITDDFGEPYQYVTSAWKGQKPKAPTEMTPEEFIIENNLSVSIDSKLDGEYTSGGKSFSSVSSSSSSESLEYYSETESYFDAMSTDMQPEPSAVTETDKSSESKEDGLSVIDVDMSDLASNNYSTVDDLSVDKSKNFVSSIYSRDNDLSSDAHFKSEEDSSQDAQCASIDDVSSPEKHKFLFKRVVEKLKTHGCMSINSEVESVVQNIVSIVLKDYVYKLDVEASNQSSCSAQPSALSCSCAKRNKQTLKGRRNKVTTVPMEIQTIVTGEIVAASHDLPHMKQKQKKM